MRQRTKRRTKNAISFLPKFQPGQLVCVSPTGTEFGLLPPGTKGTVIYCGFSVKVQVDGSPHEQLFPPDFWEAVHEL